MVHDTLNIALNERELYKAREFVESWGIGERLLTSRDDRAASTILFLVPRFRRFVIGLSREFHSSCRR